MLRTFAVGFIAALAGVKLKKLYDEGKLDRLGDALARARAKGLKPDDHDSSKRPPAAPWPVDPRAMPKGA